MNRFRKSTLLLSDVQQVLLVVRSVNTCIVNAVNRSSVEECEYLSEGEKILL